MGITKVTPVMSCVDNDDANALVSRNEKVMVDARRNFYENVDKSKTNEMQLKTGRYLGEL